MPGLRKGFARRPTGYVRRESLWIAIGPASTTVTAAGGTLTNTSSAGVLALRPFTIVRTIMDFQLQSDQAAAIERQGVAWGAAVVSDQALNIGATAIPTPITDAGSDLWFFHRNLLGDESNLTDRTRSATRVHMESRAMRKVNDDQDIAFVVELSTSPGSGATLDSVGRMLVKLH